MRFWRLFVTATGIAVVMCDSNIDSIEHMLAAAIETGDSKYSQVADASGASIMLDGTIKLSELDIATAVPKQSSGNGGQNPKRRRRRRKRSAIDSSSRYWPNARVPYEMASNMRSESIKVITDAMEEYHRLTCIKWIPKTSQDRDYVYFQDDSNKGGCWSYVGKSGGRQPLNLRQPTASSFGCIYLRTAVHEMLHALGVYHQQSRTDRDKYVSINYNNVRNGREHNFQIRTSTEYYDVPYDYQSVMHYGRTTFSKDGRSDTITTADPQYQASIGKSPTLSFQDIHLLNEMYSCPAKGSCASKSCRNGGFQGADCHCYCKSADDENPIRKCDSSTLGGSTAACDVINRSCKCSVNGCDALWNSYCDYEDQSCQCKTGYQEVDGQCLANSYSVQCNTINLECNCSDKGSSACTSIANSYCHKLSGSCVCKEDYYNSNGYCVAAPACTVLNSDCKCQSQGGDACSRIINSVCDSNTGACRCRTPSMEQAGTCKNGGSFVSDGSTVAPFKDDLYCSVRWTPTAGHDNPSTQYSTASNGYYLFANGYTSDCAQMGTSFIRPTAGSLCVKIGADLNNAKLMVYFSTNLATSWRSISITRNMGYYYSWSVRIHTDKSVKFNIKARATRSGSWSAKLDPIIVGDCNDNQYSVETSI